jgi:UDP-N-acetylglucosamine acyltransferase
MEKFHELGQIRFRKIVGAHPGVEFIEAEINGVGTVFDGGFGAFPIASRREQLGQREHCRLLVAGYWGCGCGGHCRFNLTTKPPSHKDSSHKLGYGSRGKIQFSSEIICVYLWLKMIHPTASIHPQAKLGANVRVGPFAVIDAAVELGADCVVGPHAYLTGVTQIGSGNKFHTGCVIGDAPQDLKYKDEPTRLIIGDNNVFREHATVNRATKVEDATVVGSNNFIMANAHIAHNCAVGNHVILANGALLAGHVTVQDRVFISGNALVHQFTRVGTLAIMQGGAKIGQDLPPFCIATGTNTICGLNAVGLRRAGFTADQRMELKQLYHALFRSGKNLREAIEVAGKIFTSPAAKTVLEFVVATKRGVCTDSGARGGHDEE